MPLEWVDDHYTIDGEEADDAVVTAFRDAQIDEWAVELIELTLDELGGNNGPSEAVEFPLGRIISFGNAFLARIAEMVISAFTFARGGADAMTDADYTTVAEMVDEQTTYGRGFLADLRVGALSAAQAAQRASLYAGAITKPFEMGKGALRGAPPFPAVPGERCAGQANCRCAWSIEETETEWRMSWMAAGDRNTCSWCAGNARRWNPLVVAK